jgi:hypothetical protein
LGRGYWYGAILAGRYPECVAFAQSVIYWCIFPAAGGLR